MDFTNVGFMAKNLTEAALDPNNTCPYITGNPDLYGLGIRAGIYIQMWTVQLSGLASAFLPMENTLGEATIIFVMSSSIILLKQIVNQNIQPVEAFFVITLLLVQIGVCRGSFRSFAVSIIMMASFVGLTALFVWFWWHGMDTLPRTCDKNHDKAFFFAKVSIWHWFRTFNKVTSIISAIGGGVAAIVFIVASCIWGVQNIPNVIDNLRGRGTHAHRPVAAGYDSDGSSTNGAARGNGQGGLDIALNIGIILYVELALKWNKVTGVHQLSEPGQYMPFFIALAQFFSLFWGVGKTLLQLNADEDQFAEDDDDLLCPHEKHGNGHNDSIALTTYHGYGP